MKKIIYSIALFIATLSQTMAQTSCVPDLLNATAVVRDANGNPVTSQVDVKVEIYHGDPAAGGTLAFCEQQQNIQPNNFGEITIQFGAGNLLCVPPNVLLSAFQWQNCAQGATHFKLSWRVTGSPNYTDIVINRFATVPYTFVARTAENLSIPATAGQVLKYDGTKWAAGTDNTGGAGYTAGSGISISGSTIAATDNSATNELQTLSYDGSTGNVTISNGNSIKTPTATFAQAWGNSASASTSAAKGTWVQIVPSAGNLTVPETGYYMLTANLHSAYNFGPNEELLMRVQNLTTNVSLQQMLVSGLYYSAASSYWGSSTGSQSFSRIVLLNAGDLLQLQGYIQCTSAPCSSNTVYFDNTANSGIQIFKIK